MSELTTEYLDQAFEKFETKMDTKLATQTAELKTFTEQQVEKLAIMVQRNVVEPMNLRGFKI